MSNRRTPTTSRPLSKEEIRERIINAGIKNLNEFGYATVNKDNILTDDVYSQFFRSMLNDNLGKAGGRVDIVILELLETVKR